MKRKSPTKGKPVDYGREARRPPLEPVNHREAWHQARAAAALARKYGVKVG